MRGYVRKKKEAGDLRQFCFRRGGAGDATLPDMSHPDLQDLGIARFAEKPAARRAVQTASARIWLKAGPLPILARPIIGREDRIPRISGSPASGFAGVLQEGITVGAPRHLPSRRLHPHSPAKWVDGTPTKTVPLARRRRTTRGHGRSCFSLQAEGMTEYTMGMPCLRTRHARHGLSPPKAAGGFGDGWIPAALAYACTLFSQLRRGGSRCGALALDGADGHSRRHRGAAWPFNGQIQSAAIVSTIRGRF